jgi:hypothetical protein
MQRAAMECVLIHFSGIWVWPLTWPDLTPVVIVERLVLRDPKNRRFPKLDNYGV